MPPRKSIRQSYNPWEHGRQTTNNPLQSDSPRWSPIPASLPARQRYRHSSPGRLPSAAAQHARRRKPAPASWWLPPELPGAPSRHGWRCLPSSDASSRRCVEFAHSQRTSWLGGVPSASRPGRQVVISKWVWCYALTFLNGSPSRRYLISVETLILVMITLRLVLWCLLTGASSRKGQKNVLLLRCYYGVVQ